MTYTKDTIKFIPFPTIHNFIDRTNQVFGRLTVIGYAGTPKPRQAMWFCECECKTITRVLACALKTGNTTSCGCWHKEMVSALFRTHGESRINSPEYKAFCAAKHRCNNIADSAYKNYGGRGIKFKFDSFNDFLQEVGRRPSALYSLDRINVNGHYEKDNLRWATPIQQARNTRRNLWLTVDGITKCASEWAKIQHVPPHRIRLRLSRGWCQPCSVIMPWGGHCVHVVTS